MLYVVPLYLYCSFMHIFKLFVTSHRIFESVGICELDSFKNDYSQ